MQQWEMTEVFTFPSMLGSVTEETSFKVEPNWQQEVSDDSILLKGVYVVKGHVHFDFEPVEDAEKVEGVAIEHLDIENDKAYFEYAIPFSIDLPNEGEANVKMKVIDPQVSILPGANCRFTWQARCEIEKKAAIVPETPPVAAKVEVNNVTKQPEEKLVEVQENKEIKEIKESLETKEIVQELESIKTALAESEYANSEEVDFFDQLAEAYSVIQVHLNAKK